MAYRNERFESLTAAMQLNAVLGRRGAMEIARLGKFHILGMTLEADTSGDTTSDTGGHLTRAQEYLPLRRV